MFDNIATLDEEEKPLKKLGGKQRLLIYSSYITGCLLSYLVITALYRRSFNFWVEDFFVLIGVWSFLSIVASILLYPLGKIKGGGLGVLVMITSLFALNLFFTPLPITEATLKMLQVSMLSVYFLFFIGISELLFRWLSKQQVT